MASGNSRDPRRRHQVDQDPPNASTWEIPDLEEELGPVQPRVAPRSSPSPGSSALGASPTVGSVSLGRGSESFLDDELFVQDPAAGALELALVSPPEPAATGPASGGASSLPPNVAAPPSQGLSTSAQGHADVGLDHASDSVPVSSSDALTEHAAPSVRTRLIRRAPVAVQPQLDGFLRRDGVGRMVAGGLLVLASVVTSATSCSYLSLTGERFSSGWMAGLLLLAGLGLVAHGWLRGSSRP
jgi:hypothetical protein